MVNQIVREMWMTSASYSKKSGDGRASCVMCGIGVERVYVYSGRGLRLIPDAMNCIATASEPHIAA